MKFNSEDMRWDMSPEIPELMRTIDWQSVDSDVIQVVKALDARVADFKFKAEHELSPTFTQPHTWHDGDYSDPIG